MTKYSAKLTPADQVCPMSHTPVIACYRHDDPEAAYEAMAKGLKEQVRRLPFLAGYIARGDQGYTTLYWDDNVTGDEVELEKLDGTHLPTFKEMEAAGMNLSDYDFSFRPTKSLTREMVPKEKEPVLLVCCVMLRGGCVTAYSPIHQYTDAPGQVCLMEHWAACSAGAEPKVAIDPMEPLTRYDRFMKAVGIAPGEFHGQAASIADGELTERATDLEHRAPAPIPLSDKTTPITRKIFAMSSKKVNKLRAALASDTGKPRQTAVAVLSGLFWCLITDIREKRGVARLPGVASSAAGDTPKSSLLLTTEARALFPGLTPRYMGNMISPAFATETIDNLTAPPSASSPPSLPYPPALGPAAALVTQAFIAALSPTTLLPKLRAIASIPDARLLALAGGNPMGPNDILLTSWMQLTARPHFGDIVGPPDCHRAPGGEKSTARSTFSYIVLLPRRLGGDGEEIFEMYCCFEEGDMRALEGHAMLKEYLYRGAVFPQRKRAFRPYEPYHPREKIRARL